MSLAGALGSDAQVQPFKRHPDYSFRTSSLSAARHRKSNISDPPSVVCRPSSVVRMRRRNRKIMVQGQEAVVRRRLRSARLACVALLHPAPPSRPLAKFSREPHGNTGNRENENLSEHYNQKNDCRGLVHMRPLLLYVSDIKADNGRSIVLRDKESWSVAKTAHI
jgi:hypothetical protein